MTPVRCAFIIAANGCQTSLSVVGDAASAAAWTRKQHRTNVTELGIER